jgi:hypothetical protein
MSTTPEIVSRAEFDLHFGFNPSAEDAAQYWRGERYNTYFRALDVSNPQVMDEHALLIRACYDQLSRYFHKESHPRFVANAELIRPPESELPEKPIARWLKNSGTRYARLERASAVMGLAGDFHDSAYMNVDAAAENGKGAFSPEFMQLINGVAVTNNQVIDGVRIHSVELTDKGRQDPFTQIAARLFDVPESGSLTHQQGGNEFASALAALQFMKQHALDGEEKPLDTVDAIAVAATIACTIPFKPNAGVDEQGNITEVTEGFVQKLGRRVQTELLAAGEDPETVWHTTNAIMTTAVEVANRDTAAFTQFDNWAALTNGGRELKLEGIIFEGKYILREPETTISGLLFAAGLMRSAPGLYQLFLQGKIPPDQVPKFFVPFDDDGNLEGLESSYPPQRVHEQAAINTRENVRLSSIFFQLHELGIAFAAVMATLAGEPHAEVPGFVNAMLQQLPTEPLKPPLGALDALQTADDAGFALYRELAEGTHQADLGEATTKASPMAAFILATAGLEKALKISDLVQRHRDEAQLAEEKHVYSGYEENDLENPGAFARAQEYRQALLGDEGIGPVNHDRLVRFLILAAVAASRTDRADALRNFLVD